ncbi:unnamed protein product [Blepharisma stoltei]|uniref:Uncharacterized protein n=1 Tax=Blepharisma stoltei TaxID=1481888 RepID=A0AAU9JXZ5_9CILI|nr:unnamed protein product [Blepharisma stoltei]
MNLAIVDASLDQILMIAYKVAEAENKAVGLILGKGFYSGAFHRHHEFQKKEVLKKIKIRFVKNCEEIEKFLINFHLNDEEISSLVIDLKKYSLEDQSKILSLANDVKEFLAGPKNVIACAPGFGSLQDMWFCYSRFMEQIFIMQNTEVCELVYNSGEVSLISTVSGIISFSFKSSRELDE